MKKIIFLIVSLLFFLCFNRTIAQEYILNENFNNNNNSWDISSTDEVTSKISDGKYIANIKSGIYWLDRLIKVDIDENKDWVFECSQLKKSGDAACGITWGADNLGSRYNFIVSSGKTYIMHKWKDYNVTMYASGVYSADINGDGYSNKLTVKKTGDKLKFYVNDQYLTEINYEPLFGKYFGFYGESGSLNIEVDYLRLYYPGNTYVNKTEQKSGEVVFNEDFRDNSNKWPVETGTGVRKSITNGKYTWEGTGDEFNSNWEFVPINLDQSRDFMVESTINKVSGAESDWGVGLLLGDDQNRFTIFGSTGKYSIIGDIYARIPSSSIRQGNSRNKLTMKKIGDKIKFYVNDEYLSQTDFKTFSPNQVGLYFYINNVKIEVENIIIRYLSSTEPNNYNKTTGDFVLNENFSDATNGWLQEDDSKYYTKIQNGKYIFENKQEDMGYNVWIAIDLDNGKDYTIETTIKKVSGIDNNGYGVFWGAEKASDKNEFTITGNGYYSYKRWKNGEYNEIIAWTESSYINQNNGSTNTIKIKKEGSTIKFYINDNYVNETSAPDFYGKGIGFVINKNQRIEINDLKVYYGNNSDNKKVETKITEEVQDRSLLGAEAAFVYDFIAIWRDDASNSSKMMDFISPKYLLKNDLDKSKYNVNLYYPTGYKIEKFDKENSIVTALVWGSDKGWMHRVYFKVVRETGKLYLYPSKFTDSNYIYPWDHVDEYVK